MDDHERLLACEHRLDRLEDEMSDVRETTYYGRGDVPGLTTRMDRVEQSRLSAKDRSALWLAPVIVGLMLVAAEVVLHYVLKP